MKVTWTNASFDVLLTNVQEKLSSVSAIVEEERANFNLEHLRYLQLSWIVRSFTDEPEWVWTKGYWLSCQERRLKSIEEKVKTSIMKSANRIELIEDEFNDIFGN